MEKKKGVGRELESSRDAVSSPAFPLWQTRNPRARNFDTAPPQLQAPSLTLYLDLAVTRDVDGLELEVDAYGRDEHRRKAASGVLQQQACLAHAAVTDREQLDLDRHRLSAELWPRR